MHKRLAPHLRARGAQFRRRHRLQGQFLLYGGRIDAGKGCEELIEYFTSYKEQGGEAQLALMGVKLMQLPEVPWVRFAGLLSERERLQALEAATIVVVPSPYESLSLLALEAMAVGTPVLCNARAEVLVEHCVKSNAGLFYSDRDEFVECTKLLLADERLRDRMGRNGKEYVKRNYRWDVIMSKYDKLIGALKTMKIVILSAAFLILQAAPRPPLTPAETLLEPRFCCGPSSSRPVEGRSVPVIHGQRRRGRRNPAGVPAGQCEAVEWAMKRIANTADSATGADDSHGHRSRREPCTRARRPPSSSPHRSGNTLQVIRGLWSTAGIADEVVEVFARHAVSAVNARAFENIGPAAVGRTGSRSRPSCRRRTPPISTARRSCAAASAYFLATLPNAGAEALLSHLTVGAHARLAEDGRRAVAQMGNQQRASADVLIMFGQAIEREQRRMRSFERFMPAPVDPMLRSRIAEMEKGITSVWTSMGITSSPFVPAAERIRGRGGEDRRIVPTRGAGPLPTPNRRRPLLKFPNVDDRDRRAGQLHRRQALDQRHPRCGVGGVRQPAAAGGGRLLRPSCQGRRGDAAVTPDQRLGVILPAND